MKCTDCGMKIDQWCVFPQGRCINCHALEFDSKPMPTAQEIRQMWGIKQTETAPLGGLAVIRQLMRSQPNRNDKERGKNEHRNKD